MRRHSPDLAILLFGSWMALMIWLILTKEDEPVAPEAPSVATLAARTGEALKDAHQDACVLDRACFTELTKLYFPDAPPEHLRDKVNLEAWELS